MAAAPGASVPPALTVTGPFTVPMPASVAFELTVTTLAAFSEPLTWSVPLEMAVGPM